MPRRSRPAARACAAARRRATIAAMNSEAVQTGVLFVCMGNICRSPTAHGVFRARVREAGLHDLIRIDSAGTHGFHVGHPPDRRSAEAARGRGYEIGDLRARQVEEADLARFDYVLAMDSENLRMLEALLPAGQRRAELGLLLDYAAEIADREVPDPYYGAVNGFEAVLDLVEAGSDALLAHIRRRHGL